MTVMTQPDPATPEPERVLSLSEIADLMDMRRPNVAKWLAGRGIRPKFAKAQGYFWDAAEVERAKAEREANERLMEANQRRRASALGQPTEAPPPPPRRPPEAARLGPRQRELLQQMEERPGIPLSDAQRLVLRRLRLRGLVEKVPGERRVFQLTDAGRRVADSLPEAS